LLNGDEKPRRDAIVHQSYFADVLAIRRGPWKLSLCPGDGVAAHWSTAPGSLADLTDADAIAKGLPEMQLYNIVDDPGETKNLQAEHPEVVRELVALLQKYIDSGRSTPGQSQQNDVPVRLKFPPKQ
jgi:hypothetical protein